MAAIQAEQDQADAAREAAAAQAAQEIQAAAQQAGIDADTLREIVLCRKVIAKWRKKH